MIVYVQVVIAEPFTSESSDSDTTSTDDFSFTSTSTSPSESKSSSFSEESACFEDLFEVLDDSGVSFEDQYDTDPIFPGSSHYLPLHEPFALNTNTEQDRKGKRKASPLSFSPRVQHAQNTDIMFQCDECSMWHLLFLSVSYQLQSVLLYR